MCQVTTHVENMLRTTYSDVYFGRSPGVGVGPLLLEAWWEKRTAPPLLLLLLSFNNCFSMCNFVLVTKRYFCWYNY